MHCVRQFLEFTIIYVTQTTIRYYCRVIVLAQNPNERYAPITNRIHKPHAGAIGLWWFV